MFGSSSTTSSRASDCGRSSMIDVFMIFIFAPLAEDNLNVSSGTSVVFPGYAPRLLRRSRRGALIKIRIVEHGRPAPLAVARRPSPVGHARWTRDGRYEARG